MSKKSELTKLIKVLEQVLESFKTPEKLSLFERGQVDGLRWAIDLAGEVVEKTPSETNDSPA